MENSSWNRIGRPIILQTKHDRYFYQYTREFFELLEEVQISLVQNLPYLQNSSLGLLIGGRIDDRMCMEEGICALIVSLQRFWEVEELNTDQLALTEEEEACEEHFTSQVTVIGSGRVQVCLPFNHSTETLGTSMEMARYQFLPLEKRLERDPLLKEMYCQPMSEYRSQIRIHVYIFQPHYFISH